MATRAKSAARKAAARRAARPKRASAKSQAADAARSNGEAAEAGEQARAGRAFWTGSISFGLLQIPVGAYPGEVTHELSFRQLDKHDLSPVGNEHVNKSTGEKVAWEDIVKGYEYKKGEYVVVTEEDIASVRVKARQTIDIQDFVDVDSIDPVYFERPYYLAPSKGAAKAYALLREALSRSKKAAIAKVVMRTREHLCLLFPRDKAIVLELLRFSHELRSSANLDLPSTKLEGLHVSQKELDMAIRLVDGMTGKWEPHKYRDAYRDDLLAMVETKARTGKAPVAVKPKERRSSNVDLMTLLQKSLRKTSTKADNDTAVRTRHAPGRHKKVA